MLDNAEMVAYIWCEHYPSGQMRRCRFFIAIIVLLHLPGLFLIAQDAGRIPDYPPFPDSAVSRLARLDQSRSVAHSKTALDSNLTLVGEWLWGDCYTVELFQDTLALIGNGQYVHILNAANPDAPVIVGEYLTDSYVKDIVVRDSLCYVLSGRSFLILDISAPTSPQEVSSIDIGGSTARLILDGPYAYVQVYNALVIVDISNPFQPVKRASHALGEHFFSMASRNGYVYVGYGAGAITHYPRIFDVRNPNAIIPLGDITRDGLFAGVAVQDTFLFLAGYVMSPFANAIKVFSISDPANPVHLVTDTLGIVPDVPYNIVVRDTLAFVTMSSRQISVFDISDIYDMRKLTGIIRPGAQSGNYKVSVSSRLVAAAQWNGVWFIERVDEDSLRSGSFFLTGGRVNDVVVRDSIAYLCHTPGGVTLLDVSDPSQPKRVGAIELPSRDISFRLNGVSDVVFGDSLAYALTGYSVEAIDFSNRESPTMKGFVNVTMGSSIALDGDLMYVAEYDSGISIFDIAEPSNFVTVGRYMLPPGEHARRIGLKGSYLFVACYPNGIRFLDVSKPEAVDQIDSIPAMVRGMAVRDSILCIENISEPNDLQIYSISNPLNPTLLGSVDLLLYNLVWVDLSVSEHFLYFSRADNQGGTSVRFIDLREPSVPTLAGTFETIGYSSFTYASDKYLFFGDAAAGLRIARNDLVTMVGRDDSRPDLNFHLQMVYPNPFNTSSRIRYKIPRRGHVELEVFDQLGKRVQTLVDGELAPGVYEKAWDATPFASGVYYCRLQLNDDVRVIRLILLK